MSKLVPSYPMMRYPPSVLFLPAVASMPKYIFIQAAIRSMDTLNWDPSPQRAVLALAQEYCDRYEQEGRRSQCNPCGPCGKPEDRR